MNDQSPFLNDNLETCKRYKPYLYEKLMNTKVSGRFSLYVTKYGMYNYVDKHGDRSIYIEEEYEQIKRAVRNKNVNLPDFAIFLGFGLGYHTLAYLQIYGNFVKQILIAEHNTELILLAFSLQDFRAVLSSDKIYFVLQDRNEIIFSNIYNNLFSGAGKLYIKALNLIEVPYCFGSEPEFYKSMFASFKRACLQILSTFGNDPDDSLIGIRFTLANLDEIVYSSNLSLLKNSFRNTTGLVVSMGPSLDKNIRLLKGLEGKVIIVAADVALKALLKHGIKPHFITSLERIKNTANELLHLPPDASDGVYLAATPVVHPTTYDVFKGKVANVYRDFSTFRWLGFDKDVMDIGPSAGNMAFKVLEYLGCKNIILIGQDLSYSEDGSKSHASTMSDAAQGIYREMPTIEIEGNYVDKVLTNEVWLSFLNYYTKDLVKFDGVVINATEGGAKIPNTILSTLEDAIKKYIEPTKEQDLRAKIDNKLKRPTKKKSEKMIEEIFDKIRKGYYYIEDVICRVNDIVKYCEEYENSIVEYYAQNLKIVDKKLEEELFNKIIALDKIYSEPDFYMVIMHYVQSIVMSDQVEMYGRLNEIDNIDERRIIHASAIKASAITLLGLLDILISHFKIVIRVMDYGMENLHDGLKGIVFSPPAKYSDKIIEASRLIEDPASAFMFLNGSLNSISRYFMTEEYTGFEFELYDNFFQTLDIKNRGKIGIITSSLSVFTHRIEGARIIVNNEHNLKAMEYLLDEVYSLHDLKAYEGLDTIIIADGMFMDAELYWQISKYICNSSIKTVVTMEWLFLFNFILSRYHNEYFHDNCEVDTIGFGYDFKCKVYHRNYIDLDRWFEKGGFKPLDTEQNYICFDQSSRVCKVKLSYKYLMNCDRFSMYVNKIQSEIYIRD